MNKANRQLSNFAENPWFIISGGIASIVSLLFYLYEKYDPRFGKISSILLFLSLGILFIGYIYSIKVRAENKALKDISQQLSEINFIYQHHFSEVLHKTAEKITREKLVDAERRVLEAICQRIENIYSRLTGRNCLVTIKLVTQAGEKKIAHTYVRSQSTCPRDLTGSPDYSVNTGTNTAFDQSLLSTADGRPSHFFSADLTHLQKIGKYANERQNFAKFYRSALVVPIRNEKTKSHVGYLCVDTMAKNRLNDNNHLYLLSGFSYQIYNFMAIMRGTYQNTEGAHNVIS